MPTLNLKNALTALAQKVPSENPGETEDLLENEKKALRIAIMDLKIPTSS